MTGVQTCALPIWTMPRQPTAYEHAAAELAKRDLALSVGADVLAIGAPAPSTLTLQAPARDLRALADAVGRALESTGPHHAPFSGYIVRVQRDELLFTPTYSTGSGASLAGDTRALAALRRVLLDAMASDDGWATLAQWGAKGPRVEVRREGPPMAATVPTEASPAPHYSPDVGGGADAWRWGGDDR